MFDFFELYCKCFIYILGTSNLSDKYLAKGLLPGCVFPFYFLDMFFKRQSFLFFLILMKLHCKFYFHYIFFLCVLRNLCQIHSHRILFNCYSSSYIGSAFIVRSKIYFEVDSLYINYRLSFFFVFPFFSAVLFFFLTNKHPNVTVLFVEKISFHHKITLASLLKIECLYIYLSILDSFV